MAEQNIKIDLTGLASPRANAVETWITANLPGIMAAHTYPVNWSYSRNGNDIIIEAVGEDIVTLLQAYEGALQTVSNKATVTVDNIGILASGMRSRRQRAQGGDVVG